MVNTEELKKAIAESRKTLQELANALGISRQGLYKKIYGINDFTATEIKILCDELGIKTLKRKWTIFFTENVS